MLADLLHAARLAAAVNVAGSGRELPSRSMVTVTSYRLGGSFMSGTVRPVSGISRDRYGLEALESPGFLLAMDHPLSVVQQLGEAGGESAAGAKTAAVQLVLQPAP